MAEPLAQTFQYLTTTANPFAGELLIQALDVPLPSIQSKAVASVVTRGIVRDQMEAIRRYPRFSPPIRRQLENAAPLLTPAIRQCLLVGRNDFETAAFDLARTGECFGIIETLLEILRGGQTELQEEAVTTLSSLVNRLYEYLYGHHDEGKLQNKNASQIQHLTVLAFDQVLNYYQQLSHKEVVVQSILALSRPGDAVVQKLLTQTVLECRALGKDLLLTSRHPGVMRFVLDSLSKPYSPSRVVDVLQQRNDPEFILATLRWVPKRWTNTQERNLRQIEQIAWLESGKDTLECIPDELQPALLTYTSATGLSREKKQEVRQWVVRHGCPDARNAAIALLEDLGDEIVQEIVLDGLDSENPDVQAWATGQLRSQHVPDALNMLIEKLDSPEACVQTVARQELQGFDLDCLLSRFETMSPMALQNASRLLQKIDPDFLTKLICEFHHSIRRRRIRAIRGAFAFGWHKDAFPALLTLLKDNDALIRRTALEVISSVPNPETIAALVAMQNDPNPRVQGTADAALSQLANKEKSQNPQPIP